MRTKFGAVIATVARRLVPNSSVAADMNRPAVQRAPCHDGP
jgi:hypothetical protein